MGVGWIIAARRLAVLATITVIVGAFAAWHFGVFGSATVAPEAAAQSPPKPNLTASPGGAAAAPVLELTEKQLDLIKIAPVGDHVFPVEKDAVGSIDFDEDMSVQVFTPYQGKIIAALAQVGDEVQKGKPLFTIDSPDLVQAESTLIAAAATFDLTSRALVRAQKLYDTRGTGGIAEKDLDQAVSDKQAAEGALRAARDAVRVFGKTEAEINTMVALRQVDAVLVVNSPITGRITARDAQPGLLVQPGNAPAPYSIADISTMWMLANVPEIDSSDIKVGQEVRVSVMADPGQVYEGKITTLGATVDASLHTLLVRSEIQDPRHGLRPGMFANFVILTGAPVTAPAVPFDGIVREGDGTMTAWVTTDRRHFTQREVKIGLQRDGYDQILDGLTRGELVVTEGALFLDNMLTASPTD
jgi:cobalt-zinc-cadmium efflux system membrane fusion protein